MKTRRRILQSLGLGMLSLPFIGSILQGKDKVSTPVNAKPNIPSLEVIIKLGYNQYKPTLDERITIYGVFRGNEVIVKSCNDSSLHIYNDSKTDVTALLYHNKSQLFDNTTQLTVYGIQATHWEHEPKTIYSLQELEEEIIVGLFCPKRQSAHQVNYWMSETFIRNMIKSNKVIITYEKTEKPEYANLHGDISEDCN